MKLDNLNELMRLKKIFYFSAFVFIALITLSVMTDLFYNYIIPVNKTYLAIFFGLLFVLFLVYRNLMKYNFIYVSDEGAIINIRFYRMEAINQKHSSIEIPKTMLIKYEIVKKFFKLRKEIIIYQQVKNRIAKYPPLSISALNNNQITQLCQTLDLYAQKRS